nr:tyrosine-type recombinase/integrase [Mesorhizobium sp.]
MSRLRTALERYVGMRQGLGYKYHGPARRLSDFVTFMEARGAETITTALAMKWVTLIGRQPSWSIRLTDVRCFAQHLAHFDPMTEVPPQDAVSPARRAKPYIYNDAEITALLAAALSLAPANALRRWTYHCLFGLIAVAGLRHSEALDLRRDDVDLNQGILTIRETKFGKSRLVPLHATTVAVLSDYAVRRDAHLVAPRSPYFFVAEQGGRLLHQYVHRVFWQLVATDRSAAAGAAQWSADSRSSSPFRRPGPDQLVSCARRCRARTAGPLDLSRPRQCSRHLLVSIRRAGANDPCRATAG